MREFFSVKKSLDNDEVLSLLAASMPAESPDDIEKLASMYKLDDEIHAIGVIVDKHVVGLAVFSNDGKTLRLRNIAVDEHCRGIGFGKTLLEIILANYRFERIKADIHEGTKDGFFLKYGFEHNGADRVVFKRVEEAPKATIKDMVAYERSTLSDVKRKQNHVVIPVYIVSALLLIILTLSLMNVSIAASLILLVALAALTVLFLLSFPYFRKKELEAEIDRYDFDDSHVEEKESYDFSTDGHIVEFNKYGMNVDGDLYYYNHMTNFISTENQNGRAVISAVFAFGADDGSFIQLPLNAKAVKLVRQFEIPLKNQGTLDYLLKHKEDAIREILHKKKR